MTSLTSFKEGWQSCGSLSGAPFLPFLFGGRRRREQSPQRGEGDPWDCWESRQEHLGERHKESARASAHESVYWRIRAKFKLDMPMLLSGLRHPGEEQCCWDRRLTAWSCDELRGNERAFRVGTRPRLTPHLGNHSSAFYKGLFTLKDVKTHADISFGGGFETVRSSSLCFPVNPHACNQKGISPFQNFKVNSVFSNKTHGKERVLNQIFYLAVISPPKMLVNQILLYYDHTEILTELILKQEHPAEGCT